MCNLLIFGQTRVIQEPGIIAYDGSEIVMHGGQVFGNINLIRGSVLFIFGRQLAFEDNTLSGIYANGTPFRHTIVSIEGQVILNLIPEPTTLMLSVFATAGVLITSRRRV